MTSRGGIECTTMRRIAVLVALAGVACGDGTPASPDLSTSTDAAVAADMTSAPAPTYASFAQAFFAQYCVSCHPSASSTRDFTMYSVIKMNSHNIACGVSPTALSGCSGNPAPGQFPIGNGPLPTDAERNELVQWIQNGLPQ
jgi:hypothetical protein